MLFSKSLLPVGASMLMLFSQAYTKQVESETYDPTDYPIFQLSADSDQAFFLEIPLSLAEAEGSNTGELLRIATQIVPGSEESVYPAFYPFAEKINALAESINATVDPVGARENYFHASTYYRSSVYYLVANQSDPRLVSVWQQAITAFNKAIALLHPAPGESFTAHQTNSSIGAYDIPGYFYKGSASNTTQLPTLIVMTGYDGSQQDEFHLACAEVLRRGINCVTLEGPGQPTPIRFQKIGFIPDYWTALTPVVDLITNRTDVDTSKIVLLGDSFGGTLAPIAASREPRLSGVIMLDGLVNLQQQIGLSLGKLEDLFKSGNAKEFNAEMEDVLINNQSQPIGDRYIFQQGLYTFNTTSPFEWFTQLGDIKVTPEVVEGVGDRPVFIARGQDDNLTGVQAVYARDMFINNRTNGVNLTTYQEFLTDLGAGEHTSIGAETQIFTAFSAWLSKIWGDYLFTDEQSY
ncbi:Alpha/Beta hydrolase protein [Neohortaea acidophila]|uniref:Alpha/Beta hydrolase protein n=1 Tax=Neohortaea acidophila TaxID=245834 RepID=A0A6A6PNQ4_9PEZI|nr:Alpha/Beta hydrolase protein [Neohortaea acidophila]KAF2481535.1 Alpha/Beta hydrolase protein [Neohortaea acidophila]